MRLVIRGKQADERPAAIARWLETDWTIEVWDPDDRSPAALRALAEADAMIAMRFTADTPPTPRLRLLQLPGAGFDQIDFDAVPPGCAVCNVFEHEIGIAEYICVAMLEWVIGFARMDANLRRGDWSDSLFVDGPVHGELYGRTVGIVGYGHIGRETARRARAFGMRVIAATRTPREDELVDEMMGLDRLHDLLAASDFVVLAVPLVPATRGLIGAAEFAAMKDDGVLINVARGAVVDEDALYAALRDRRIGGAVIDVWYRYPEGPGEPVMPSRHPFQELDNIYMTPHASGWTDGLIARRAKAIAANLDRFARGEPLLNLLERP